MKFDLSVTDELLATTRAVRKRLDLDRAVPREVVMECLELACQAPTGGNSQIWRWVIVDDKAQIKALADLYRRVSTDYLAGAQAEAAGQGEDQTARVYGSALWLAENMEKVPMLVVPCVEGRLSADAPLAASAGLFGSIFPAVWSFQLALRSRGLGSALTTLHLIDEAGAAEILGLPESFLQVAMLPVGYTQGTDFKRASRPPASTVARFDRWS